MMGWANQAQTLTLNAQKKGPQRAPFFCLM